MFNGCKNLEYINIQNITEDVLSNDDFYNEDIFYLVPDNIEICINGEKTSSKLSSKINNKTYKILKCSYDWSLNQKK